MEIGETGEHGQAAVGAVVLVSKLVLDNAITLLRKTVEQIAAAGIKKPRPATHKLVLVIRMDNCYTTIYSLIFITFTILFDYYKLNICRNLRGC